MSQSPIEAARNLFIRRWGEMAASWGVSRTMAEIHALLFLSAKPLCTDDVMEQLEVSRGSASTNLRQLVNWGLITRVHHRNDRREYFEAEKDVWQMFETILRERRRREVQPMVETIERCMEMIEPVRKQNGAGGNGEADQFRTRLTELQEFCQLTNSFFNLISQSGREQIGPMAKRLAAMSR
jgi:DNA-binding transcriptional regulator GbsR (MarR family)